MRKLTVFTVYVLDQEAARRFYVDKLGFEVAEDQKMGDSRWLQVTLRESGGVSLSLDLAKTDEEKALVGRQAAGALFGIGTDDCRRDHAELRRRGVTFDGEPTAMPFGTGVMLQDLYGNKIYMNQDPS